MTLTPQDQGSRNVPVDVTVLIPAHNEEQTIAEAISRSASGLVSANKTGEILVVDDGSSDATRMKVLEESKKTHAEVRLVRHERKRGVSVAVRTGIRNARGAMILIIPGDLESDPEQDIPVLLEKMSDADLVAGWRQGRTGAKIVASRLYNFLYRNVLGVNVHDANWIKCFKRQVADHMIWTRDWNRYLVFFAARAGFRIIEVPVPYYRRHHGQSKFGIMRLPSGFVGFLKTYHEVSKRSKERVRSLPSPMAS